MVLTRTILAMGLCIWSFIDCSPTHTTPTLFDSAKYLGPICDTFHDLAVDLATVTWRQGFWILAPRAGVDFGRPSRLEHSAEERRQGQRFPDATGPWLLGQKWYAAGPQSHWFHAAYRSRHPETDNLWIPLVFFFKSQKSKWLWYVLLILIFVNINRSSTCLIGFDWIAFLAKHVSTSFGHPKWPCRGYDQSQWMSLGRTWFCNQSQTSSAVTKNMAVLHQMVELHTYIK